MQNEMIQITQSYSGQDFLISWRQKSESYMQWQFICKTVQGCTP